MVTYTFLRLRNIYIHTKYKRKLWIGKWNRTNGKKKRIEKTYTDDLWNFLDKYVVIVGKRRIRGGIVD